MNNSTLEGWISDPAFDGGAEAVREHYRQAKPVYDAFADLDGSPTTAFAGNSGWYRYRRESQLDIDEIETGHRIYRRAYTLERDYAELVDGLVPEDVDSSWRSLYNITSWKDQEAVYAGQYGESFDDLKQGDGLAGYGDTRGFGLWVDLDLEDNDDGADGPNYKKRRGALDVEQRRTVEAAVAAYVKEFAQLYDVDPGEIAVFDSGGGAYLYAGAAATLPIAEHYEDDLGPYGAARELLFKELRKRLFAYATGKATNASADDYGFEGIEPRVNALIDGAAELLSPDWIQNRNRQSKAPLAIHGDHDIVVTPARTREEEIVYTPTLISEVDDDLIDRTAREAAKIVAVPEGDRLEGMTETLIVTLFPEYAGRDELDGWRDILDAWLANERDARRDDAHRRALDKRRQRERIAGREGIDGDDADPTSADLLTGLTVTPIREDVYDVLRNAEIIDVRDVIRDHASNRWDTSNRGHETTFAPSWRASSSGQSCAVPNGENGFVDNGCDGGGGPAKAYALGTGILPEGKQAAAATLDGREWTEAIVGLRSEGYSIPVYVPEAGTEDGDGEVYDQTPLWALRNAAVALGVVDAVEFVEREGDDGGIYLGFPDAETYDKTIKCLEGEHGIDTGRELLKDCDDADEPVPWAGGDGDDADTDLPVPGPGDGFEVKDGTYGRSKTKTNEDGEEYLVWNQWTNFQIELTSVIRDGYGNVTLRLRIHPIYEESYEVDVEPTVLNEITSFKKEVCTGRTTTWDAGHSQLAAIKQFVGRQDTSIKDGTRHMGLNDGLWVTPDGALGPDGWVDDAKTVYIRRGIDTERRWQLTPDDGAEYNPKEVAKILSLLVRSRDPERFLPVLGWYYAATLRPYILEWEDEFNLLTVSGETGAGKTTTNEVLWPMFGMTTDGISIDKSSDFVILNALASTNSIPMWFDEYKPADLGQRKLNAFHQGVRAVTKGGSGGRGNADKTTDGYPMHAPVAITGEERLRGSAEERRSIFTVFRKDSTRPGTSTKSAFEKLKGGSERVNGETRYYEGHDLQQHALAWIQWLLGHGQDEFLDLWRECYEWTVDFLTEENIHVDEDLVRQGLQTVKFGCELLRSFERDMRVEAGLLEEGEAADPVIADEEIERALVYLSTGEESSVNRKTHVDTLLEVAGRAANSNYLEEGVHYGFIHKGEGDEELRINLNEAFDKIRRYVRDHDIQVDMLSAKSAYDSRIADEIEEIPYITRRGQWTEGIGRAIGITTEIATDELDGFGRWQFDEETDGATRSKWQTLDSVESGRISITVRCKQVNRVDTHESKAEEGTFEDETKTVDYVMWARDAAKVEGPTIKEGGCYSVRGALMDEFDGAPQIKLDGATTIKEVEPGFEYIERPDSGANRDLTAVGDGGSDSDDDDDDDKVTQLAEHVECVVDEHEPADRGFITGLLLGRGVSDDPTEIEGAIERLSEYGRITDFGDGYETEAGR